MKKTVLKIISVVLAFVIAMPVVAFAEPANGGTADTLILTDVPENTYVGRQQASRLIERLRYNDLPANPIERDAVIRAGAFDIMRPTSARFRSNDLVTRQEAISYAIRAAGMSADAMELATELAPTLPTGVTLNTTWFIGYLHLAAEMGLITAADFENVLAELEFEYAPVIEGQEILTIDDLLGGADTRFNRTAPATRQEIASWVVGAMQYAQENIFDTTATGAAITGFTDWNTVSPQHAPAVETLVRHNVMSGTSPTLFAPNGFMQRRHMAQVLRNLDTLYFNLHGLERRVGAVADITNEQYTETGAGTLWRHIHVRRADGAVDMLRLTMQGGPSPQAGPLDAVVHRDGSVHGLAALMPGDQIEYIVHPATGTVWYVQVTSQVTQTVFRGRLEIIDMENATMTFRNIEDTVFTFPMSTAIFGTDADGVDVIRFPGNEFHPAATLPRGTFYDVTLVGNVIMAIEFVGQPVLVPEHRGLVIENNPYFGYITILDANREEQSFTFNAADLMVHRRQFFDMRDQIGGLHEMFPGVQPHVRMTTMASVIPGDIVVFRVCDEDPFRITEMHAAENIAQRYGRILEIVDQGGYFDMLMEFDNGQNTWFTFVDSILVTEHGRPVSPNHIQQGDWARILVNQANIAPGVMMESVREINIDSGGHHITSVLIGQLSGFNAAQNTVQLRNARELTPAGWTNNRPLATINISPQNTRYYHNGNRVTLAHLNRYTQRTDATVYVAMENHFAGERAIKVSVRTGRDELLSPGTVIASANNAFNLLEITGDINTDAGTIVVRNGRLVESHHIFAPDWARVSLNGRGLAAVVDISQPPATSGVQLIRGRVSQVWPFESFRVEPISIFDGFNWNFSPITREFVIDHDTIFIDDSGVTSIDDFIGWGADTVVNDVFTIVVDGGRAARVIDMPFTEPIPQMEGAPGHLTVRGIIYETEGGTLSLRDMTVFNAQSGAWTRFSAVNPTGSVNIHPNTLIIDRNQVIPASRLQVGQQIMAFSPERRTDVELQPGMSTDAFIILVES